MDGLIRFLTSHIGRKLMVMVGLIVAVGFAALVVLYAQRQQESILAQQERTLTKVTDSVVKGLRTVMLAGYADIGHALFDRLRAEDAAGMDIRILRPDGSEAFFDNATVRAVNERLGQERFRPRDHEEVRAVLPADDPHLRAAVEHAGKIAYRDQGDLFTLLMPIATEPQCEKCHGSESVRAVLKVTTSLAPVREDIRNTWIQATAIHGVVLVGILLIINLLIRRIVVRPVNRVTLAMMRAAEGDLTQQVPVVGHDELGEMATSFNQMIANLLEMYSGLEQERDKLSTILLGAEEGIVVTDGAGNVALINQAAERLLDKSAARIRKDGFGALLDDPQWMAARLDGRRTDPETLTYHNRILSVLVARIEADDGRCVGMAALLRDVTDEVRFRAQLQRLSDTDALTGLYNRRFFDAKLADELTLADRYGHPLSLLLLDVDHFKKFNDSYGHDQGDRVLQAMAMAMRECAATTDAVCRYGGEEFVQILPGVDGAKALATAERLRRHVEAMRVDGLAVTISIGVATVADLRPASPEDLIKAADGALYAAKKEGRNRVCSAPAREVVGAT